MQARAFFKWSWSILYRFIKEGYTYRAASLVYATLLSMVPMAVIGLSVLTRVPGLEGMGKPIQSFVFHNFVSGSADRILSYLERFWSQAHHFSVITLIFLVVVCVMMVLNMMQAFDSIWKVEESRNKYWSVGIIILVLLLGPALIGLSIVASTFLFSLPYLSDLSNILVVKRGVLFIFPYALTFIGFWFLNWIIPAAKVKLKAAAVGALTSTVLFELGKWGFAAYLKFSTTYKALYGALSIIPFFLVWVYVAWLIVLFGVMVSFAVQESEL